MRWFWNVRSLFASLRRLWAWLPIIWEDRDFDQAYLYRIMAFKLRRMQRVVGDDGYHVGSERDAKNIAICAHILERLASDDSEIFGRERELLETFAKIFSRHSLGWWT